MYLLVLEALLSSIEVTIYTSVMSKGEVAFGGVEQTGRLLDPAVEDLINGLWADLGAIVVEGQAEIGEGAKRLIRGTFPRGWRLKPADAIHLATAKGLIDSGVQVAEFHTCDKDFRKYSNVAGFTSCEPNAPQPSLIP